MELDAVEKYGYEISKGKYIIFCDDDDYYIDDEFFYRCIEKFYDENISMICSNSYIKNENKKTYTFSKLNINGKISNVEYLKNFQFNYNKPCSTFSTIFRKATLEKAKFNNMEMVNDSSIYLRVLLVSSNIQIDNFATGVYRVHSGNISKNIEADFLIKNLEEKKYVYKIVTENKIFNNEDKWFENQVILTTKYFISGTNPSNEQKVLVYNWIVENCLNGQKVVKKIKKYEIENQIKKHIKKAIGGGNIILGTKDIYRQEMLQDCLC